MNSQHPDPDVAMRLPSGYRANLAMISLAKRWLTRDDLAVAERLHTLKSIKEMACGLITAPALAAIEPACGVFEEIVAKAVKLSIASKDDGAAMCKVLERPEVFENLLRLNPSLIRAAELCKRHS
jgi:hypothetical protein